MRPVQRGDGVNRSRRLSTSFRPAPARRPTPFTQYVGDRVRGIMPAVPAEDHSFKLGSSIKLGQKKLGG